MRLELRGLLFYFVSYLTIEEHEGREALFRHGCVTSTERRDNVLIRSLASAATSRSGVAVARCAALAFQRLFRKAARGSLCGAWGAFCSALAVSALTNDLMGQTTQRGDQRVGLRWSAGKAWSKPGTQRCPRLGAHKLPHKSQPADTTAVSSAHRPHVSAAPSKIRRRDAIEQQPSTA